MKTRDSARDRYLAVASACFAEAGLHGTSLATLADRAGVTKQALLHFFSTKDALYAEVLRALCDRLCADLDATQAPLPGERIARHLLQMGQRAGEDPRDARLLLRAVLDARPGDAAWPLRPYLNRLELLALQAHPATSSAEVIARLVQRLGAVHLTAAAQGLAADLYGADGAARFREAGEAAIKIEFQSF